MTTPNPLDRADAAFRRIFPAGEESPHDYAREGFAALREAREWVSLLEQTADFKVQLIEGRDAAKAEVERLRMELDGAANAEELRQVKAERDVAIARAEAAEALLVEADEELDSWDDGKAGRRNFQLENAIGNHIAKHGGKS